MFPIGNKGFVAYLNAEQHTIAAAHRLVEALTWAYQDRRKRPLERRLAVLVRRMFARQAAAIARKFMPRVRKAALLREAAELPADLGNLLDAVLATDANNWARQLLDVLGDAWLAGAGDLKGDISPSFDMPIDRPRDILADRAGDRITRIDDVTRQAMRDILVSGIEQRKSYQQVARELRKIVAVCVDDPKWSKETSRSVADWIRRGCTIERMTHEQFIALPREKLFKRPKQGKQASLFSEEAQQPTPSERLATLKGVKGL